MNQSEQINELSKALSNAQKVMKGAKKNKKSNHGGYADINSVLQSCKIPLAENELSIMQGLGVLDGKMALYTQLTHSSGQWVKSCCFVESEAESRGLTVLQAKGKALSYMKRYSLCSLLGLEVGENEDDDGDSDGVSKPKEKKITTPISSEQAKELETLLDGCEPNYQSNFWSYLRRRVPNLQSMKEIPLDMHVQVLSGLSKKCDEYQASQEEVNYA